MPEDVKIGVGFDVDVKNIKDLKSLLEETKKLAASVEIKDPKQAAKAKNATTAATLALEGELTSTKIKAFKENIQIIFDVISKAATTGSKINAEYEALEKKIKLLKADRGDITGNISTLNKRIREREYTPEEAIQFFDKGRGSSENDIFAGQSSAEILQKYKEIMDSIGWDFRKLTDTIGEKLGGKAGVKTVRDTIESGAKQTVAENKTQQEELDKEIKELEDKLKSMSPVIADDNEVLEKFIRLLYKIQGISSELTSKATTEVKGQEKIGSGPKISTGGDIDTAKGLDKQSSSLGKAFKQFTIYSVVLKSVKKALREAVRTIKDLDKALTEQAMVTGLTRDQTYDLLGTYQNMAKSLGATTKEISSTMTAFLRQGRSITESTKLTEAAVAAAKVASISTADSVNYLTTAINGFRLSASDAMKVSDKFAAVAATAATSYEEIAIAMSKVAAQANLAGMSIDYTTALLTKGLETTREAPETIGTALKTIIARMRELTDYGATLEDGMDLNNVETQLAYVGIALRDNSGELRSTEDVLDELGKRWDDLTANQQAAIAKALAGTRQQSRLIAMMSDYERVIELQEIAERSQGATMAQMATYLEGMDAALNRVNVAWEKVVSAITNSDLLIGLVNVFSYAIESVGALLENTWSLVTIIGLLALGTINIVKEKTISLAISKQQQKIDLERNKLEVKEQITKRKSVLLEQDEALASKQTLINEEETLIAELKQNKAQAEANGNLAEATRLQGEIDTWEKELAQDKNELNKMYSNDPVLQSLEKQDALLEGQESLVGGLTSGWKEFGSSIVTALASAIPGLLSLIAQTKAARAEQKKFGKDAAASSAASIPWVGWIIWAIITGASIIGIVWPLIKKFIQIAKDANNSAKQINDMSSEIYNLNKEATALNSTIDKFDQLDKKVLKTNEDLEEMSSLLQAAAEDLSEEEQEAYNKLQTDKGRRDFLEKRAEKVTYQLEQKRIEQREKITGLSDEDKKKLLTGSDSEWVQARDAIYAQNNQALYDYIDKQKEAGEIASEHANAVQKLTQAMLEELDAETAWKVLDNPSLMEEYTNTVAKHIKVINNEKSSLKDISRAYRDISNELTGEAKEAFDTVNQQWLNLANLTDKSLDYIADRWDNNIEKINDMADAIQDLGYKTETSLIRLSELAEQLSDGNSIATAITNVFGYAKGSTNFNAILKAYDKVFGVTTLNLGQNITAFQNQISGFYEKVSKWSSMSAKERSEFLSENGDLFKGEDGKTLLKALQSNDYDALQKALSSNNNLLEQREHLLEDINNQLDIELSRTEDIDYAFIEELKTQKAILEDVKNLYYADLETRLSQEQKQLNAYKDYLNKQKEALEKSLNDRKDAYQKYFDNINKEEEYNEYDEQANLLISNLTKLSSSNSASAQRQSKELEKQLQDLEKERLKTLREQAQEAVIQGIENEVSQINDKFDKLLESNKLLLSALVNEFEDPEKFISQYLSTQLIDATALEIEDLIKNLGSTFGALYGNLGDQISIEKTAEGNIIIHIGDDREITLNNTEDATQIQNAIYEALKHQNINTGLK